MRRFISEFREFASRGSVVDLAVGVVIGIALYKIVDSIVNDLVVPILAGILGKPDFSGLYIPLASPPAVPPTLDALRRAGVPIIAYGNFLAILLSVIVLLLIIFAAVRRINHHRAPPATAEEILLLREIRDAVKRS